MFVDPSPCEAFRSIVAFFPSSYPPAAIPFLIESNPPLTEFTVASWEITRDLFHHKATARLVGKASTSSDISIQLMEQ